MLELIFKDIEDKYVRENFFRVSKFLKDQVFFDGSFDFYEVDIPQANLNFAVRHGLKFIPTDVFFLAVDGDHNFYFKYQDFDRDFIYISANGPCVIRFIAGRLTDTGRAALKNKYPLVGPSTGGGSITSVASLTAALTVTNPAGPNVQLNLVPSLISAASAPRVLATFTTDVGTAAKDLLRVNAASTVTKITTNAAATIPNGIFGIGFTKPTSTSIQVAFSGIIGGYSGFTVGSPLFVSTGGVPTHTVPTTGVVQQIGFAVSTTELFVQLMLPTVRS